MLPALVFFATLAAALPNPLNTTLTPRDNSQPTDQPFQAGVWWSDPDKSVYAVSGRMVLPELPFIQGGAASQLACTWVGIWGDDCGFDSGLLQAGADGAATADGYTWTAFYEWPPAAPIMVPELELRAGDELYMQVVATSATTGTVVLANGRTGVSRTIEAAGQQLCRSTAEWIVEDQAVGDSLPDTELANFGTVTMTDALAISGSEFHEAGEGHLVYMMEDGRSRVSVAKQGSQVTMGYNGR